MKFLCYLQVFRGWSGRDRQELRDDVLAALDLWQKLCRSMSPLSSSYTSMSNPGSLATSRYMPCRAGSELFLVEASYGLDDGIFVTSGMR